MTPPSGPIDHREPPYNRGERTDTRAAASRHYNPLPARPAWVGYLITTVLIAVTTLILWLLVPTVPLGEYPVAYILIVVIAAYYFGEGPAILALFLGWILFNYFFIAPIREVNFFPESTRDRAQQIAFLLGTVVVGLLVVLLRRSRQAISRLLTQVEHELEERIKTEKELRDSRTLLQSIIDNSPNAIYVKDLQGRIILANQSTADIHGYNIEDMIGKTVYEIQPAEIAAQYSEDDRYILDNKCSMQTEEVLRLNGDERTYITSKFPLYDSNGVIYALGGIYTDITERKRAEEQLDNERRQLQIVLRLLPVGVVIADAKGRIVRTNDEAHRIWGGKGPRLDNIPQYEAYKGWWTDTGEPIKAEDWAMARALSRDESSCREVIDIERFDGTKGTIMLSAVPIHDSARGLAGAVAVMQDITELATLQRQLRDSLDLEIHLSRQLQGALLPIVEPIGHGYSTGNLYVPAYVEREVGGDFYDAFVTADGKIAVLIGDVSGKGLEAAAFAASTRATIHAFAYHMSEAGKALTHANRVLSARQDEMTVFVTVFLVIIEPETGAVTYAGGGHPPPAILRTNNEVEFFRFGDPPIGPAPQYAFREETSILNPNECIVLYTDGITEARHGHDMFGEEGISRILIASRGATAQELADNLVSAVREWAEGRLTDDVAVIVVGRQEES